MFIELFPLILLGFGLGMMHALDADHVMAVSALSNQKPSLWRTLWFSASWAVGHGGILLASGLLLFGLGIAIPESLQRMAEMAVGLLLIVLGIGCFWQFRQEKLKLQWHSHGDIEHNHWHDAHHTDTKQDKKDRHVPVMVGSLHGLAGSAPALALIPAVGQQSLSLALAYLVTFSVGVMLSMMVFGFGLGYCQRVLKQRFEHIHQWSRRFIAIASSTVGVLWLYQAI